MYYWKLGDKICSHIQEENLNSVKHLYIVGKKSDSITATLRHMIPLRQLAKLVIECGDFPMEDLIKLLRFTSNVHTLE
ncbi:unnamed protein product [Rotaria sordida]|uniref:Uncharacterized protein n=2 Tax=Rotaria sordida TaxID=392033 RepID=A0A819EG07_9BILA|nr:unnamed protein product [Rotaria sordida]CAF1250946.1 unnamed protein product [Rotaria sordida]CAF3850234.1 unnamed protein product [Rotaria sordida]